MREQIRTLTASMTARTTLYRLFETLLGFLFSNIILVRGIMPFGIAYSAVGPTMGFLGALVGYLVSGRDPLRILTACFMARVFRMALKSFTEIDRPLAYSLYTLWGTMLGGLVGFFLSDYTPKENLTFMLNGAVSAGIAWMFTVAASAFSNRPLKTEPLRYVSCILSLSALLAGGMSFGGAAETAGRTALIFVALCLGRKCSFFYTMTTVSVTGLILVLFSPKRLSFFLILFFGTLLTAALRPFGKHGQVFAYALSAVLTWVCTGRSFSLFSALSAVILAGLIFLILPAKALSKLTELTIPSSSPPARKFAKKFRFRIRNKEQYSDPCAAQNEICRKCPKQILCKTKYRKETARAIRELKEGLNNPEQMPRAFLDRCIKAPELIKALRSDTETVFGIRYAKAFAQKEGELLCGDTATGFRTVDDRYIFAITDGMGTGSAAARQSVRTSKLMETLSKNGVDQEDIFRVVNRALITAEEETVVGMDVVTVDLKSGICECFKAGAAPTYILRNGIVYEIGSDTLPVGILEEVDLRHTRCNLLRGDYLILVSDGIIGNDRKWLSEYLNRMPPPTDCLSLAEEILSEAKRAGRNKEDDITVLAVQIQEATKEEAA